MFEDFDELNPVRDDDLIDDTLEYAEHRDFEWKQHAWCEYNSEVCSTTYCIAGFRAHLDGFRFIFNDEHDDTGYQHAHVIDVGDGSTMTVMEYSRKRFGLMMREADELFFASEYYIHDVIRDIKDDVYRREGEELTDNEDDDG